MTLVLVTGAGGFIGRALMRDLAFFSEYDFHATTRRASLDYPLSGITWHQANLSNLSEVDNLFSSLRPQILIQLAWCSDHGTYWRDPANLDWVCSNINIARSFVLNGGKRAVFVGSSAEYDWSTLSPLNETLTSLKPQKLYGSCKAASFLAVQSFLEQEGISCAWARLFNPFGLYEDCRRLIPKVCLKLLAGEMLNFDSGTSLRDFLHVHDVASGILALTFSDVQGPVNVASGVATSIRDLIESIASFLDRQALVSFSDVMNIPDSVVADVTRLHIEVGWSPSQSFKQRLEQTCHWWKMHSHYTNH